MLTKEDRDELLNQFGDYWNEQVDKGEVSPLDSTEYLAIRVFLEWLGSKKHCPEVSRC